MKKLSEIFMQPDRVWLVPGEDFVLERTGYVISLDEEEELDLAFELPSPTLERVELPGRWPSGKIPFQDESMAWGGMALALKSIAECLQISIQAFEHSSYDAEGVRQQPAFSVLTAPTEVGYQSGRI